MNTGNIWTSEIYTRTQFVRQISESSRMAQQSFRAKRDNFVRFKKANRSGTECRVDFNRPDVFSGTQSSSMACSDSSRLTHNVRHRNLPAFPRKSPDNDHTSRQYAVKNQSPVLSLGVMSLRF
jgi:hypothetical protein